MTLFFILTGFVIVCFIYYAFRKQYQFKQIITQLNLVETQNKQWQESEKQLRKEIKLLQGQLDRMQTDPVTHLLGWQFFEDRLNQSIKESERYQFIMGVLVVDIDDFKMINDALSYEVGDRLLKKVATCLQSCIRQVDSISRFTKDTFVISLSQLAKPETAVVVAQRILQELAQPFQIKEHELYITACIGIALYPADGTDAASLLRNADHALHLAKEKGKHTYHFYQESLHLKSQRELALYTRLNRESVVQEWLLYYQPIVNVENETIVCMDALLYWQHPELGLIDQKELFKLAEKQHKLNFICEWLLQNAGREFVRWRTFGFSAPLLAIPMSVTQLGNSPFICRLSQILQELTFKPEWLLLEIKGNFGQLPFDVLEKSFNMLNYLGVNIAIDDFGNGTFSLCHLKQFTVNYLKLDPSLVKDIEHNQQAIALVKSIMVLAKNMSLQVIVQGIESDEQMTLLKKSGCLLMQGQHLSAPLSEREVTAKMVTLPT